MEREFKGLWTEQELAKRLDLKIAQTTQTGKMPRCRTLTELIRKGLSYYEINGHRYFHENDVMTFLEGARKTKTRSEK